MNCKPGAGSNVVAAVDQTIPATAITCSPEWHSMFNLASFTDKNLPYEQACLAFRARNPINPSC